MNAQIFSKGQLDERLGRVLAEVAQERARQDKLVRDGKFPYNCSDVIATDLGKLPILGEEFGEVSKEVYENSIYESETASAKLRTELIQLAAVAVAWVESLTEVNEGNEG